MTLGPVPEHPLTFWGLVEQRAASTPDDVMLEDDRGGSVTFGGYRRHAEEVAAALFARGITSGSVVSWQIPTSIAGALLMAALPRLDAVQNPIIPILREREVTYITGEAQSDLVIAPSVFRGFDYHAMLETISAARGFEILACDEELPVGDPSTLPPPPSSADAVSLPARWLYHTSGSTADPKGVWHTDASIIAGSVRFRRRLHAHIRRRLSDGLPDHPHRWRRDTRRIDAHRPAPRADRHLRRRAQPARDGRARGDVPRERDPVLPGLHGRATQARSREAVPAAAFVCRRWRAQLARAPPRGPGGARRTAGCARAGDSPSSRSPPRRRSTTPTSSSATTEGRPSPQRGDPRGRRPDGSECAPGERGRAVPARAHSSCRGYADPGARCRTRFDDQGYLRTGDLGMVLPSGHVRITGRLKDVVIRNAENISATEVEDVLHGHPEDRRRRRHRRARSEDRRAVLRGGRTRRRRRLAHARRDRRALPVGRPRQPEDPRATRDRRRDPPQPDGQDQEAGAAPRSTPQRARSTLCRIHCADLLAERSSRHSESRSAR